MFTLWDMKEKSTDSVEKDRRVTQAKQQLRKLQRLEGKKLPSLERQNQSVSILNHLKQHPLWDNSKSILGFMQMPDEPDIFPLLQDILECGKNLYLPRYVPESNTYQSANIRDLKQDLTPGKYGIFEPNATCPVINTSHMDLTLVPGLAFDSGGWRLGRGKGYYDRLLVGLDGVRCGIAFDFQWVESVPHETLDQKMDWIITPSVVAKATD
jgi:5-formyltetrahydrofolate cyclo-ligase